MKRNYKKLIKTAVICLSASAVFSGSISHAQAPISCLTGPDTRALVTLILDRGSEQMLQKCTLYPIAQRTPFLSENKDAVLQRFDNLREQALGVLTAKIRPNADENSTVSRQVVLGLIDQLVNASFGDFSGPDSCANADILSSGLATLEDEQIIDALTVMAQQILGRNNAAIPLPICGARK